MEKFILEPDQADTSLLTPPLTFTWRKPEQYLTADGSVSDAHQALDIRIHIPGVDPSSDLEYALHMETEHHAELLRELLSAIEEDSLPLLTVYRQGSPYLPPSVPQKDRAFLEYSARLYNPGKNDDRRKRTHRSIVDHRETFAVEHGESPNYAQIFSAGLRVTIDKVLKDIRTRQQ